MYRPMAINFSAKVHNTDLSGILYFVNMRAYAYWTMRDLLDPDGGQCTMLPPDQELLFNI